MAEIVGLVSGAAGLASLSMQILGSAQTLKGFCNDVKNAPKRLSTLSFDLETLSLMLRNFEHYRQVRNISTDEMLEGCVFRVQEEVGSIEALVNRLGTKLRRSGIRGRLWMAFEDPEIEKSLDTLERTKTTLSMALQSCFELSDAQNQSEALIAHIDRLISPRVGNSGRSHLLSTADTQKSAVSDATCATRAGDDELTSTNASRMTHRTTSPRKNNRKQRCQDRKTYKFTVPLWLTGRVWSIAMCHSNLGFDLALRTWTRHERSPAFYYCEHGDLPSLREMIAMGQIGRRDQNSGGWTMLELAVAYGQTGICSFLLHECGLSRDSTSIAHACESLTDGIFLGGGIGRSDAEYINIFNMLLESDTYEHNLSETNPRINDFPFYWLHGPYLDIFNQLLHNELLFNNGYSLFEPEQILQLTRYWRALTGNPKNLVALFGINWSPDGFRHVSMEVKQRLLSTIATVLEWGDMLRMLIEAGADVSALEDGGTFVATVISEHIDFANFLNNLISAHIYQRSKLKYMIRTVVSVLRQAGISLIEHGLTERETLRLFKDGGRKDDPNFATPSSSAYALPIFEIDDLAIGKSPLEWSLKVRLEDGLTVWRRKEMPGSWQSKDEPLDIGLRGLWCRDLEFHGWEKIQTVVVASKVVDISEFEEELPPCPFHGEDGNKSGLICPSRYSHVFGGTKQDPMFGRNTDAEENERDANGRNEQFGTYWEAP